MAFVFRLELDDRHTRWPAHLPELDAQLAAGRQDPADR